MKLHGRGFFTRLLEECKLENLRPEWRLAIAYAAALRASTIALALAGFRATRDKYHYRTIHSLLYTLNTEAIVIAELDLFRKKRNATMYDQIQAISDHEAERMIELAALLRDQVVKWVTETRPTLLK